MEGKERIEVNNMADFPKGFDLETLKQMQNQGAALRQQRFNEAHKNHLEQAALKAQGLTAVVEQFGAKSDVVEKAAAERRQAMQNQLLTAKPTPFKPVQGHNPARYAPFDFSWDSINCGGITACSLYGPNAETGEAGADLAIFNGGGSSAEVCNGFWYYSQHEGTLYVDVQAWVWGRGYIFSGLFGYAQAYAGLSTYVEEYVDGVQTGYHKNRADIYNHSGILAFDITTFDWVVKNVAISVPVRANTWYAIWGCLEQNAYAGGIADAVSNFDMYLAPVVYFME